MWGCTERNKELRAVGVWPGVGHAQNPRAVVGQLVVELVVEGVAGATATGAGGVPTLNHEALDDPVEDDVVVQRSVGHALASLRVRPLALARCEPEEVADRPWYFLLEQFDRDISLARVQRRCGICHTAPDGRGGENSGGLETTRSTGIPLDRQPLPALAGGSSERGETNNGFAKSLTPILTTDNTYISGVGMTWYELPYV